MSDSYLQRLRWVSPVARPATVTAITAITASEVPDTEENLDAEFSNSPINLGGLLERALRRVRIPTGSTDEARSSAVLEARDLLRAAAEIEHGLLVQYLYAAYSCTKIPIRSTVAQIAKEEMGHLISVENMLLAIGGHPYFGREHFPTAPTSDEVFPFALAFEPISLESLAKYVVAESPPLENITDQQLKKRVTSIIAIGKGSAHQEINHVGALYVALYWLFMKDDNDCAGWPDYPKEMVGAIHKKLGRTNWHVPIEDFAKKEDIDDLQADNDKPGEIWNMGDDRIYVRAVPFSAAGQPDRVAILKTIFDIADQGEGWQSPITPTEATDDKSHFLRFLETYESVMALPAGTLIAAKVPINPSTVTPTAAGFISNSEANLWAQIFNVRYRIALLKLALSIASRRSLDTGTPDGRSALISDSIDIEMKSNLKSIAQQLVRMRRKGVPADGTESLRAAPPFELPAGSLPNLVGLDPDPKIAEEKAIKLLRRFLKQGIEDAEDLVKRVEALPTDLLDAPRPERQLLADIVTADAKLKAALG